QNDIYALTGLTFGYLSNSAENGDIKITGNNYKYSNNRGANEKESGFFLGLGYDYLLPKKNGSLSIEMVWNRSFGKSYGGDLIPNPQEYYNQTFNMRVGYKFFIY